MKNNKDSLYRRKYGRTLTEREYGGVEYANNPSKYNPFLTREDLKAVSLNSGGTLIEDLSSVKVLTVLNPGDGLVKVTTKIEEAFDIGFKLSIGSLANPELICSQYIIRTYLLGRVNKFTPALSVNTQTTIIITPYGSSSAGKIRVWLR